MQVLMTDQQRTADLQYRFEKSMIEFEKQEEMVERLRARLEEVIKWREVMRERMMKLGIQVEAEEAK